MYQLAYAQLSVGARLAAFSFLFIFFFCSLPNRACACAVVEETDREHANTARPRHPLLIAGETSGNGPNRGTIANSTTNSDPHAIANLVNDCQSRSCISRTHAIGPPSLRVSHLVSFLYLVIRLFFPPCIDRRSRCSSRKCRSQWTTRDPATHSPAHPTPPSLLHLQRRK